MPDIRIDNNEKGNGNEITRIENIHDKIIEICKDINKQFIELGAYFDLLIEKRLYKEKGYDSFNEYIGQPEIPMELRTAQAIVAVYRNYFKGECNQPRIDELVDIGYTKLERIIQYKNKENFSDWVEKARTLSLSDLNTEIREAKGDPGKVYNPKSKMVTITCPYCNKSFEHILGGANE